MADDVKKVIIPPQNLMAVNISNDIDSNVSQYLVRYRIISEDKTRKSAWSPIYNVVGRTVADILEYADQSPTYTMISQGSKIQLSWEVPTSIKFTKYDVYTQWQNSSNQPISTAGSTEYYPYFDTSTTKSLDIPVPTNLTATPVYLKVWVQIETFPKNRSSAAKLFESSAFPVQYRITGGSIA